MNKGKYYVLPEDVKIEKKDFSLYTNGKDTFAYHEEKQAEYAVAIGSICECGKFIGGKSYYLCTECRNKKQKEKYQALEETGWDGETPLCEFNSDVYFFSEEDILDHCDYENISVKDLELVECVKLDFPHFDIEDHCCDSLPEDFSIHDYTPKKTKYSAAEVEDIVNAFLEDVSPGSWIAGNKRVSVDYLEEN